jgi:hypothetical protein
MSSEQNSAGAASSQQHRTSQPGDSVIMVPAGTVIRLRVVEDEVGKI